MSGEWKAIETAPMDGTEILAWIPERIVSGPIGVVTLEAHALVCAFVSGGWTDTIEGAFAQKPILWQPIISPATTQNPNQEDKGQ